MSTKKKDIDREALIDTARRLYADRSDDNIEVDDDAKVSRGEVGTWVQAWVYVRDEE